MTSIASVADTAEEKFVPYYDLFMPSLKHIVENAVQKELRLLRGKTIECISLIGLAVGKEKVHLKGDGSWKNNTSFFLFLFIFIIIYVCFVLIDLNIYNYLNECI